MVQWCFGTGPRQRGGVHTHDIEDDDDQHLLQQRQNQHEDCDGCVIYLLTIYTDSNNRISTCTYIHAYIHTYIHTHTHTYMNG